MKQTRFWKALCLVALAAVWIAGTPAIQASEKCSNASVAGDWSFTLTGTIVPGGIAVAAVAAGKFDENGNISNGTEARSVGGSYADETITGYWTVNSDCTGTLYANIYQSGQLVRISVVSMTFDDNSSEMRGVQKSLTLPDGTKVPVVISLEGHQQHSDR